MYVLIDDGSAMRPPIGSVTLRNVAKSAEAERVGGLAVAVGHGLEARAEVLGVERAAPDHHREPGDRERVEADPGLRQREEEHEDLDENRRVPDDLDVGGGELADDGDAIGARGAEHDADRGRAGDRDDRDLERVDQRVEELTPVLRDERPEVVDGQHRCVVAGWGRVADGPPGECVSAYGHTVSRLGRLGDRYAKSWLGRRLFFRNAGTKRGAM